MFLGTVLVLVSFVCMLFAIPAMCFSKKYFNDFNAAIDFFSNKNYRTESNTKKKEMERLLTFLQVPTLCLLVLGFLCFFSEYNLALGLPILLFAFWVGRLHIIFKSGSFLKRVWLSLFAIMQISCAFFVALNEIKLHIDILTVIKSIL